VIVYQQNITSCTVIIISYHYRWFLCHIGGGGLCDVSRPTTGNDPHQDPTTHSSELLKLIWDLHTCEKWQALETTGIQLWTLQCSRWV